MKNISKETEEVKKALSLIAECMILNNVQIHTGVIAFVILIAQFINEGMLTREELMKTLDIYTKETD